MNFEVIFFGPVQEQFGTVEIALPRRYPGISRKHFPSCRNYGAMVFGYCLF